MLCGDLGDVIAGGLFLQEDLIPGTYTLGGLAQGTPDLLFGYELGVIETWLTILDPGPGVVAPGATETIIGQIDTNGLIDGDLKFGAVVINSNAVNGVADVALA